MLWNGVFIGDWDVDNRLKREIFSFLIFCIKNNDIYLNR